jgi:hypothetical protein
VIVAGKSLNGASRNSVSFMSSSLFTTGGFNPTTLGQATVSFGPLSIAGSTVQFGNGGGTGPYGLDKVVGSLSLDSLSTLNLWSLEPGSGLSPKAGFDYPQIAATGAANLGSAAVNVWTGCNQSLGTSYTIVKATGGVVGTFSGLPNGTIIQGLADNEASCHVSGATAPYLQINYGANTATATVVPPPSAATRPGRSSHPGAAAGAATTVTFGRTPLFARL